MVQTQHIGTIIQTSICYLKVKLCERREIFLHFDGSVALLIQLKQLKKMYLQKRWILLHFPNSSIYDVISFARKHDCLFKKVHKS